MLRSIGVRNTILGTGQLLLDIFTAFFRLLTPRCRLNDVRKLDDKVELSGTALLIDCVQQVELPNQTLHSGVGLIHDRVERIFHNGHGAFRHQNVLFFSLAVVVDPDFHMLRIPLQDFSGPHRGNVKGACLLGIECRVHRDNSNAALVQHRHDNVLNESSACLVDIRLQIQTVVQTALNDFLEPVVLVQPDMLDRHRRHIQSDAVINRGHNGAFVPPTENRPVRTVGIAGAKGITVTKRVAAEKRVPCVPQPGTKRHFHSELITSFMT